MQRPWRNRDSRIAPLVAIALVVAACGSTEPATGGTAIPTSTLTPVAPATSVAPVAPVASTTLPASATTLAPRGVPRVLLIGDSTLLAVERYNGFRALQGFEYVFDAKSCRTLGIPSCGDPPLPPNAVETIAAADGVFDYVVVMAGYDEWWNSFPDSFDEVVDAARAKGTRNVIWLTYPEGVEYKLLTGERADEAFIKNNQTLRDKVATGSFPDVILAQWYPHTPGDSGWLTQDGIHLTIDGALGVADYISRWVAFIEGRPCPMPTVPGGTIETICPNPDTQPLIADVLALYET